MWWQWWTIRVQVSPDSFNQFASFVVEDITNRDKVIKQCCKMLSELFQDFRKA